MRIRRSLIALLIAASLSVPAFALGTQEPSRGVPVVAVSILPQRYFVERIGGDRVRTLVLVGPGQSPHSYEPTPRQMTDLGSAAVWFSIGVEFETGLMPKVRGLYPKLRVVDTTEGVRFRTLETHHHEGEEAAEEGGRDPHIWLGREPAKLQASYIRDTLSAIDPAGSAIYTQNYNALIHDIDSTFDSLAQELAPLKGKPVFVYHPSFGYFLDEFGIEQVAVELGGKEPTQKALVELIEEAKEHGAKTIFVQPQFSKSAAKTIADSIGGVVAEINPLDPDWLDNLKRIGQALKASIR